MKKTFSKENIMTYLNKTPLWIQLSVVVAFVMLIPIMIVSVNMFRQNRSTIVDSEVNSSTTILNLEISSLDQYIKDLTNFCIQPCYDSTLTQILNSQQPLNLSQSTYAKEQFRSYYYSRQDLNSYHLYMLNHRLVYIHTPSMQRFEASSMTSLKESDIFKECSTGPLYLSLTPSENDDSLFVFTHAIIKIKSQEPVAIVSLQLNHSIMNSIIANHSDDGEFVCLLNKDSKLLFTSNEDVVSSIDVDGLVSKIDEDNTDDGVSNFSDFVRNSAVAENITIDGVKYLVTSAESRSTGLRLLCLKPYSVIDKKMDKALWSSIVWGMLLWALSLVLIILVTRLTTSPLTTLAHKLKGVGKGDFTSTADIEGSEEILHLSRNFHYMIDHIDHLIKTNYISQLNEKNARIIALEAQLNPHFLYNTLQAIATEALVNDQPQIYTMITSLASNLRYSIKAGDFVQLRDEYKYADNYISLQKMRLGDRLLVDTNIAEETLDLMIPKISIQTLVENSVIHGMGNSVEQMHISIISKITDENLIITVTDNGCGFTSEQLSNLQNSFAESMNSGKPVTGIGLLNLYSRLHLLYAVPCELVIDSKETEYTKISMIIPLSEACRKDIKC